MRKSKYIKELAQEIESLRDQIIQLKAKNADFLSENQDLSRKLEETKRILAETECINMTIKEKALPKCESAVCLGCTHCETQMVNGERRIVGCRKDIDCAGYMPKPEVIPVPYPLSVPPLPDYNSWTMMNSAARMMNGRLV